MFWFLTHMQARICETKHSRSIEDHNGFSFKFLAPDAKNSSVSVKRKQSSRIRAISFYIFSRFSWSIHCKIKSQWAVQQAARTISTHGYFKSSNIPNKLQLSKNCGISWRQRSFVMLTNFQQSWKFAKLSLMCSSKRKRWRQLNSCNRHSTSTQL